MPWHSLREAPYLIHTGFELALMLEGRKPFAKFANHYPSEWFDELIGRFDPFVEEGRIVRRILTRPFPEPGCSSNGDVLEGVRDVYFALPGQEWRIDAYLLLCEVGSKAGWSDALVHYEGSLLGYEDWQNDWWIERSHRRLPGGWTRVLQSNELPTTIVGRQGNASRSPLRPSPRLADLPAPFLQHQGYVAQIDEYAEPLAEDEDDVTTP